MAHGYSVYLMKGGDTMPIICDGMPFLVDASVSLLAGNGIYPLTLHGKSLVRYFELANNQQLLLRCANERYREPTNGTEERQPIALQVLGKVCLAFELKRF